MIRMRRALWNARLARFGRAADFLAELRKLEPLSVPEVATQRDQRLTQLLRHAHANVPYYQEQLEAVGVVKNGVVDLTNFHRLPLLDKPTIRSRFDELTSRDTQQRGPYPNTSGGSTGEPVNFVQDAETNDWKVAVKLLFDSWTGYRQGEPFAMLWGAHHELVSRSLKERVGSFLRNELRLNAYLMSITVMDEYISKLNAFKPELILAYAQSASQLADHAERTNQSVYSPRAIMTSATTLEPVMRATIERVFDAPVFDRYGSREVGDVACENGDGLGLVVSPLTHLVEVIGPDGLPVPDGSSGELVVTLLTNYSMPLIRYRIGDAGILGPAVGDSPWPRLTAIIGRVTDIFYTPGGDQVYGGYFTRHFYGKSWVAQFQVVQETYDHLIVRIVPAEIPNAATLEQEKRELITAFKKAMGVDCRVDIELVDEIEVGPTGKRRYTISKVGPPA